MKMWLRTIESPDREKYMEILNTKRVGNIAFYDEIVGQGRQLWGVLGKSVYDNAEMWGSLLMKQGGPHGTEAGWITRSLMQRSTAESEADIQTDRQTDRQEGRKLSRKGGEGEDKNWCDKESSEEEGEENDNGERWIKKEKEFE